MFGKELILDLYKCSDITERMLRNYVYELCKILKMERYGDCQIVWFGKPPFEGYSLLQFITTSSITGHFTKNSAYINIFSCADFDEKKIALFTLEWFKAEEHNVHLIKRK